MTFSVLYNKANGIGLPYSEDLERNRADLIALTEDEVKMLRKVDVNEILARRTRMEDAEASIEIVRRNDVQKGVSVDGEIERGVGVGIDEFGNVREDYTRFWGRRAPIFLASNLYKIPDTELVRFARESMHKIFSEPADDLSPVAKQEYYGNLRAAVFKLLERDRRKKTRRAVDAKIAEERAKKNAEISEKAESSD